MEEEFTALQSNDTWTLVPQPSRGNVVTSKWIFRHKLKADGILDCYKARCVLWGFTQCPVLIMMKSSAWLSSLPLFGWFFLWLLLVTSLSISWT
uniref:Reverse transcriptase Ty1/copia-type domain-containing protein n=1 Tax=Arundo donax TaxID=35708 RepID=A0A0A9B5L9_ARUDO